MDVTTEIEINLRELEDMSRDELLDKVEELERDLKDAYADIEKLTARLEEAADVMAESGAHS